MIASGDVAKYKTAFITSSSGAGVVMIGIGVVVVDVGTGVVVGMMVLVVITIGLHMPPSGPENPSLHLHAVAAVLAAGELEWAGQAVQSTKPLSALNLPASQAVQSPSPGPVLPALHGIPVKKQLTQTETAPVKQTRVRNLVEL
jgi:hypothetical protein